VAVPTPPSLPTEREPAEALGGRRALERPHGAAGSRSSWPADDLHLLRLMCQITDYQFGAALGDDASVLGGRGGERALGPEARGLPGAGRP
jgi:hypothetical protein